MTTKAKTIQITRHLTTLLHAGLSADQAISRIAHDSSTDKDTILMAIHYALAA